MDYIGVIGEASTELVIERSRFLGYCARTAGEEEAGKFLSEVRARHPMATHVCYGYIADRLGNLQRFSDDGEPQGTAGMPILGVLKAQKLYETAVAVVRYFGGIKLGAGGLTRAYASAAADCTAAAEKRRFDLCTELKLSVGYSETQACMRFLEASGAEILKREFGTGAAFTVALRASKRETFSKALVNALNGRVTIEEGTTYFHPFPMEA